jgi:fatty acid desaturase
MALDKSSTETKTVSKMTVTLSTYAHNSDAVRIGREIYRGIKQCDLAIRQKYSFLYHQDLIGALIFTSSSLLMFLLSYAYLSSYISAISAIVLIAFSISILHELEHDIIHNLYFKKHKWIQNFIFLFIWIAKLHISPWYRRQLHLKHHLLSGQMNDAEERLIGLGLPLNYKRMAITVHPFGGVLVSDDISKDAKYFKPLTLQLYNAPMGFVFFTILQIFLIYNLFFFLYFYLNYDINTIYSINTLYPIVRALAVCLCLPNVLRQSCLVMMSNSSHYYSDIPLNTLYYQNQILDSWYVFPFQLFCFNFAATHIVHHYFPSQPFYIRHITARRMKDTMIKLGVRHNDFGILWRNNRYIIDPKENEKQELYGKLWFVACLFVGFPLYILWDIIIFSKLSKNLLKILREKISNDKEKQVDENNNDELPINAKMFDNKETIINDGVKQLNTLVNRIALHHVSADQIEEVTAQAVEA